MKLFLTILAYLGLVIILLASAVSLYVSIPIMTAPEIDRLTLAFEWSGLIYFYGVIISIFGAILALIGSLIARTRYLWISLTVVGSIYILSFLPLQVFEIVREWIYPELSHGVSYGDIIILLIILSPGIACISAGLGIRKPKRSKEQAANVA